MGRKRICGVVLASMVPAAIWGLSAGPVDAGTGPSQTCDTGTRVLTTPVTVAAIVTGSTSAPAVQVCYSTTPDGQTGGEATGGSVLVGATLTGTTVTTTAQCSPDPSANITVGCNPTGSVAPTYALTGPSASGATISVSIPFQLCVGQCAGAAPSTGLTGVVVGQLQPLTPPTGTTGVGYQLTGVTVYVAGTAVPVGGTTAGAYTNPNQVAYSLVPSSPCLLGECLPLTGYVETTGGPLLVVVSPLGSLPVAVPATCLYNNGMACPTGSSSATASITIPTVPPSPTISISPPSVPTPTPPPTTPTYTGVAFAGATGTLTPPTPFEGGSGTYTFNSVACVGVRDVGHIVGVGGPCTIAASGTYVNTFCGTMRMDGTASITAGLSVTTVNFSIQVVSTVGVLTGADNLGNPVVGVVQFLPTGGNCLTGVTQWSSAGAMVFQSTGL